MISGKDVDHPYWEEGKILYDDGAFSAIWGRYAEKARDRAKAGCSLGIRWNGNPVKTPYGYPIGPKGYPIGRTSPAWFAIPHPLILPILNELLRIVEAERPPNTVWQDNLKEAIKKANEQFA